MKTGKPPLQIIGSPTATASSPASTGTSSARKLGKHGQALWKSINDEYEIDDAGGIETLMQVCLMVDRVEGIAAQIRRDGLMIKTKSAMREHPLLKVELGGRAFITRNLARLGINIEAVRSPGRPAGGGIGVSFEAFDDEE